MELNPFKIQLLAGNDLCLNSQSSCYVKLYFWRGIVFHCSNCLLNSLMKRTFFLVCAAVVYQYMCRDHCVQVLHFIFSYIFYTSCILLLFFCIQFQLFFIFVVMTHFPCHIVLLKWFDIRRIKDKISLSSTSIKSKTYLLWFLNNMKALRECWLLVKYMDAKRERERDNL